VSTIWQAVGAIVGVGFVAVLIARSGRIARYAIRTFSSARADKARYCTKHILVQTRLNGPWHKQWIYQTHRTPGNQCDGPEHRRSYAWTILGRSPSS